MLFRTSWGKNLGTWGNWWEHDGNKGKEIVLLTPLTKRKKAGPLLSASGLLISCMKHLFPRLVELPVKSCPLGPELHPSFDASSPHGCCPQSNEILSNKDMKYWDSGLNAWNDATLESINRYTFGQSRKLYAFFVWISWKYKHWNLLEIPKPKQIELNQGRGIDKCWVYIYVETSIRSRHL